MNIQNKVRKLIKRLPSINWGKSAYDESYLILKWGENPYSPSQKIIKDMVRSLKTLNRYPILMGQLKDSLTKYTSLPTNQITLTNGLDKAFRLIAEVFINAGDESLTFIPSYPVFDTSIEMMGGKITKVQLKDGFVIPSFEEIQKYLTTKTKIIYICNPNNPTGNFIATTKQIKELLQLNIMVVVDEAYYEFSKKTCSELLSEYNNLIILRSFSKSFGLAGLRVGYILASPEVTRYMAAIEESLEIFNISTPSLAGAISSLDNFSEINKNIIKITKVRDYLETQLKKLNITTYPSYTSFMLFNLKQVGMKTSAFITRMEQEKFVLKDVSIYEGLSEYDAYTAIPQESQVERLISSISKVISIKNYDNNQ